MKLTKEQEARLNLVFLLAGTKKNNQNFWISRLETMPEEVQDNIITLFEMFPEEIDWFRKLQLRKEKALTKRDRKAWQEILEEEGRRLSTILTQGK